MNKIEYIVTIKKGQSKAGATVSPLCKIQLYFFKKVIATAVPMAHLFQNFTYITLRNMSPRNIFPMFPTNYPRKDKWAAHLINRMISKIDHRRQFSEAAVHSSGAFRIQSNI